VGERVPALLDQARDRAHQPALLDWRSAGPAAGVKGPPGTIDGAVDVFGFVSTIDHVSVVPTAIEARASSVLRQASYSHARVPEMLHPHNLRLAAPGDGALAEPRLRRSLDLLRERYGAGWASALWTG
jgi:hypothetical protein